jgi:biopolymer transport protein ExbD
MMEDDILQDESESRFPDLTPLIDVIFILIVFFLLTPSISERLVEIRLPEASASMGEDSETVLVFEIDRNDIIYWQGNPVEEDKTGAIISAFSTSLKPSESSGKGSAETEAAMEIRSDRESSFGVIVKLMDQAKKSGIYEIRFTVAEKRE